MVKGLSSLLVVLLLATLFTMVTMAGCYSRPPFEDITWVMESYGDPGSLKTALPDVRVTLFFDSAQREFAGNTGCNSYSGSYELRGSKLSFPDGISSTLIYCGEEIGRQEEEYLRILGAADSYQIEGGRLRLNCDQQVIYYKIEQEP